MENKKEDRIKSRDIFYVVIALATLIVAIIGATLAYFSITASSAEGAVNAKAAVVSVNYEDSQQITTNAKHLIPADFDVVKSAYQKIEERKTAGEAAGVEGVNYCRDDQNAYPDEPVAALRGYEVCNVYRFSISSDAERNVTAKLLNEYNGFTYLSYAVYDVTNGAWVNIQGNEQNRHVTTCTDDCFSTSGTGDKVYKNPNAGDTQSAVNSLFGYSINDGNTVFNQRQISSTVQTYDIVLFIKEDETNQNKDQGAEYRGTIQVEVTGGNTGRITGRMSD